LVVDPAQPAPADPRHAWVSRRTGAARLQTIASICRHRPFVSRLYRRRPPSLNGHEAGGLIAATSRDEKSESIMIIHASTVELAPNELTLLRESGLPIEALRGEARCVQVGRADFAGLLRQARAANDDPAGRAVIISFLKQLRA
jgi:hypothetical protein